MPGILVLMRPRLDCLPPQWDRIASGEDSAPTRVLALIFDLTAPTRLSIHAAVVPIRLELHGLTATTTSAKLTAMPVLAKREPLSARERRFVIMPRCLALFVVDPLLCGGCPCAGLVR